MGTTLAEIKQGLSPGERVLNGGQDKYHEDEEVSALPVASPASETVHESGGMIDLKGEEASENAGGSH
jgi:hypothetical protein